jgi:hypothetical protein
MKTGLPGRATQARASAPAGPTNPPGGIMRDGPLWFAALAAIGIGVLLWERRRERTLNIREALGVEPLTRPMSVPRGVILFCSACGKQIGDRRYILPEDWERYAKDDDWHRKVHALNLVENH